MHPTIVDSFWQCRRDRSHRWNGVPRLHRRHRSKRSHRPPRYVFISRMPLILPCQEVVQVRELSNACLQLLLKIFELYLFMSSTFLRPSPGIQVKTRKHGCWWINRRHWPLRFCTLLLHILPVVHLPFPALLCLRAVSTRLALLNDPGLMLCLCRPNRGHRPRWIHWLHRYASSHTRSILHMKKSQHASR